MQYYQKHVLSSGSKAAETPGMALNTPAVQPKQPPSIHVPYMPKGENSLVQQYLKEKIVTPKPPVPKKDDLRRYYAPVSDPKEISLYASHYVVRSSSCVPA